ncbi:hypothetical protein JKI95_11105 [Corynebacterium aquatimens]|uniref:hypothetical protein n=1 Tax=Corynebacterium TaxID=1716 RepID=UPI001F42276F|nr:MULTISPECIES: hypothetical protein [Corynebacterium]QYH19557.1 hypothetical protein JKI95_11105 [Corynebacterium aquatimens]UIZ91483.1 hypothetical protein JZY91_06860 [Corynebacterium sp. CNCTC7651]
MRNFRNAAVASATALALIASGTTAALAQDVEVKIKTNDTISVELPETTNAADASDREVLHTGTQGNVAFKGFAKSDDKKPGDIISDAVDGANQGKGSSRALSGLDTDKRFDGRDAFGKETNWQNMPQWSRIWVDATIVGGIGALIGLLIAGVNFLKFNGVLPR